MPEVDEYTALRLIEGCDPDGGARRPTEADYAAHEGWAVERFGRTVWERYARGGWGREVDYPGAWS